MKNAIIRGIKYLKFRKFKSLMLVVLMVVVCSVTIISATIDSTIEKYYQSIDTTNGISVSAQPVMDFSKGGRPTMASTSLSDQQLEQIASLEYISDISQSTNLFVTSDNIQVITYEDSNSDNSTGLQANQPRMIESQNAGPGGQRIDMSGLKILGSSHLGLENDFVQETVSLVSGVMPNSKNEVLISDTLASLNGLALNDTFTVTNNDVSTTLRIVGIYEYNGVLNDLVIQMVPENTLYTNFETTVSIKSNEVMSRTTTQFFIRTASDFDQFELDYYTISGQTKDEVTLTLNDAVYTSTIQPLIQLSNMFSLIKWVVLVIFLSVLMIVSYLMIKERNYEIGVLYSLSERKSNILVQLIFESTVLLSISFVIGLIINMLVSTKLINYLINMDIFNAVKNGSQMMGGMPSMSRGPGMESLNTISLDAYLSYSGALQSFLFLWIIIIVITVITVAKTLMIRTKDIVNG